MPVLITLLAALLLGACQSEETLTPSPDLVVEGWIDEGDFPIVILTRALEATYDRQPVDDLKDHIERWATVRISDGEHRATLIGKPDKRYFPPYIYTTTELRGRAGRTYTLTVDCTDGTHAQAQTTIPAHRAAFTRFTTQPVDTLIQLYGHLSAPPGEQQYYKLFTQSLPTDSYLLPAYMGVTHSGLVPPDGRIAVNRGATNLKKHYRPGFRPREEVRVKLATIDSTAYGFWRDYEDMLALSRNPLFPLTANLRSNVSGALGYWFGYNSAYYRVVVE